MPAQVNPPDESPPAPTPEIYMKPPETATIETVGVSPASDGGKSGKSFIIGLLIGMVIAILAGVGAYLWQQDVGKREVEAANARVSACNDEKDRSLSAAEVWKDQFVKLSQTVNSQDWIAEHCQEVSTQAPSGE